MDFDANYTRFLTLLNLCDRGGLIALPELFLTGFYYKDLNEASACSSKKIQELEKFSAYLGVSFVFSAIEKVSGKFYNTAFVIDDGKVVFSRPKIKLFSPFDEDKYFVSGKINDLGVAETKFGIVAPVVCFELRFSEIFKVMKAQGAQIFAVIAQWHRDRKLHFEALCRSRALEFQRFVLAANATGQMAGSSTIVDPWGNVLAFAGDSTGLISANVSLKQIQEAESKIPMRG